MLRVTSIGNLVAAFSLMGWLAGCDAAHKPPKSSGNPPQTAAPAPLPQAPSAANSPARVSSKIASTTFGRAVSTAVRTHPDIGIASADIASAEADLHAAKGAFRPALSLGANLETTYRSSSSDTSSSSTPYFRISQLIYDGGAARSEKAAALAGVTRAEDARLVSQASSAMAAVEAYMNVLSSAEMHGLLRRNLSTHQEVLAQVEERQRFGAGTESDVLTIRSRMADAQTMAIDAQATLQQARARYEEVFGTAPSSLTPAPHAPQLDLKSDAAISLSPRMRTLMAEIDVANARLAQARAQRIPRVELGSTTRPDDDGGADVKFDLSVEYSFDNRRQSVAAIERSEAEVARLEAEKTGLIRDIRRALDYLATDRDAGTKRLNAARNAVSANGKNVTAAREEFSIGRRTLLEVLDAQRDFVSAQQTVVNAKSEQILTGYQALALTGDIVAAFGITVTTGLSQP